MGTPALESQDPAVHTTSVKAVEVSGQVLGELEFQPQVGTEDGKQNSQGSRFLASDLNHRFEHGEEETGNTEVSASVETRTGCTSWKG